MSDGLAHAAHLTIASFANRHFEDADIVFAFVEFADEAHFGGGGTAIVDDDAARETFEGAGVWDAAHARLVDARHFMPRMRQARGEFAVVGEEQQSF